MKPERIPLLNEKMTSNHERRREKSFADGQIISLVQNVHYIHKNTMCGTNKTYPKKNVLH